MNNEEKILLMLEALTTKVDKNEEKILLMLEAMTTKVDKLESKVDKLESKVDKLESKVDKLDVRMDAAEKQAARNLNFILEEFERSDKRILGYLENMALNEAGEQAKASLGLL